MTKPFPCFCECVACTDYDQPWYGRSCAWDTLIPLPTSIFNGTVFNFGVITPTSASVPVPNSASVAGMYGESELTLSFTPTSATYAASLQGGSGSANIEIQDHSIKIKLRIWYTNARPCDRRFQVHVTRKLKIVSISSTTGDWSTNSALTTLANWQMTDYMSFSHSPSPSHPGVFFSGSENLVPTWKCTDSVSLNINATKSLVTFPDDFVNHPNSHLLRFIGPSVYSCYTTSNAKTHTVSGNPFVIQHSSTFPPCAVEGES
jgi:hypothetical protein